MPINHYLPSEFPLAETPPMEDDSLVNNLSSYRQPFYSASRITTLPLLHSNYPPSSSWLAPYGCSSPASNLRPQFDLNHMNDSGESAPSKEHLFEKPLTPSDVGKLNRLVIPKQHAERYFPLAGDTVEKGLLLSFEDETGKSWKFRYSYWNSSQSYVLTKGWSRYVKEKQLDAGDIVLFQRHRLDGERLFIGWRRRGDAAAGSINAGGRSNAAPNTATAGNASGGLPSSPINDCSNVKKSKINHAKLRNTEAFQYGVGVQLQNEFTHAGASAQESKLITIPRKVRLFGVNLECQVGDQSSEPSTPDGSSMSSQNLTHQFYNSHLAYSYNSASSSSHMVGYNY